MKKLIAIAMALALLLTMALSIPVVAETPPEAPSTAPVHCKVVGSGYFYYDEGCEDRVDFELRAVSAGTPYIEEREYGEVVVWPARGKFFMIDHASEVRVYGTFESIGDENYKPKNRILEGECIVVKGEVRKERRLAVEVKDKGESEDWILIEIIKPEAVEAGVIWSREGVLENGNISITHRGAEIEL